MVAMLVGGKRYAAGIFVGAMIANLHIGNGIGPSILISLGAIAEAYIASKLLPHGLDANANLTDYRHFLVSSASAAAICALIGCGTLLWAGSIPPDALATNILHWWQGNFIGILYAAPFLLVWRSPPTGWLSSSRVLETLAFLGLLFLAGQIIFLGWFSPKLNKVAYGYWEFLFIAWGTMRFGIHGTLLVLVVAVTQALLGAILGVGFFANDYQKSGLYSLWFYVLTLAIVGISLASAFRHIQERARKIAEDMTLQLRTSEQRWKFALEGAGDGVWDWDIAANKVSYSTRWYEIQGFENNSMPPEAEAWEKLVHPEDLPVVRRALQAHFLGETPNFRCEHRVRCADGKYKWILGRGMVVSRDIDGNPLRAIGTHSDITQIKQANEAIVISEQKLSKIFKNSPVGIFISRISDGVFIEVNDAFLEIYGYPRESIIGHSALDLNLWESKEHRTAIMTRLLQQKNLRNEEISLIHQSGKTGTILASLDVIEMNGADCVLGIIIDITERKKTEEKLNEAWQLEQLTGHLQNELERERTRIARDIHDELGGTLTALKLDLRRIAKNHSADPDVDEAISLIDTAIRTVKTISTELRPSILDHLGLVDALEWAVDDFSKRTHIANEIHFHNVVELSDKGMVTAIFRILQEALTNIAKHSEASKFEVTLAFLEDVAVLTISDNGRGFNLEQIDPVHCHGLTGIRERVHYMGGKFSIDSTTDKGTTLRANIPLKKVMT